MDINIKVPAIEKLVEYVASGIGSIAGSMLAPWKARKQAKAKLITAEAEANSLRVYTKALAEARILMSQDSSLTGKLDIQEAVNRRIQFQELKRQSNIEKVARKAKELLGDMEVENSKADHDWIARFFNDVQDVSSEKMQFLWAKILAGEIEQIGSTSIRTLGILKNLDQATAHLFQIFCSVCIFFPDRKVLLDARVPSLGGHAGENSLAAYGLNFDKLNQLNEHGLIIADYNSWRDYQYSIRSAADDKANMMPCVPFHFQNRFWVLAPVNRRAPNIEFRLSGVAMTQSGKELSKVIEIKTMDNFFQELDSFFQKNNLQMTEVTCPPTFTTVP